ncbi:TIGR03560 family F420-dependent LLM class oxidoreductase [Nocardia stercoris]|uniref:TIGR03560 family F420-dependent LLM class oxidoreductase n=1 Tax=Nocardia stercoris TaxID=2483361 RepID=A0A3M2L1L1_9NOCA|nr:TIGR03560 family F420-dependent LLM class oxidoreductase [Nocardia stercoris]RMI30393.1 TIGR03560 family F420-dependent LLM class oxidoreductase [Nocardia stercoris]
MRISISLTDISWPHARSGLPQRLADVAAAVDAGGIDTLWVPDHLIQAHPRLPEDDPALEAYTLLGYLAARTSRVRLGTMVSAVTFRPPGLLIKAVTALDVLSGGRAWFGIGAGHHVGEAAALGLPFPATGERFDRLEETLRLATRMFDGDERPFHGTHYRLERPLNHPQPVFGRPRILIGGMGEQRTLPLVARYADACNLGDVPDGGRTIGHKLRVLAGHCERIGRSCNDIEKTVSTALAPGESAGSFADRCAFLATLGIGHVTVIATTPWTEVTLAPVLAAVSAVGEMVPAATLDHPALDRVEGQI